MSEPEKLFLIGGTQVTPETGFFWSFEKNAMVEVTNLNDYFLLRATKGYRLLKQDEKGRETMNRRISKLNDYLAETFSNFRLSIDYFNELDPSVLDVKDRAEELAGQSQELVRSRKNIQREIEELKSSKSISLDAFQDHIQAELLNASERAGDIEQELDNVIFQLEDLNEAVNQWERNGVSAAIVFSFSTDPEIVTENGLENAVDKHLDQVYSFHRTRVKQTLGKSNFRLIVEDIEQPKVFNRFEHSQLLNPKTLAQLQEENPELTQKLEELKRTQVQQLQPHALKDIQTSIRTHQKSKSTPGQAFATIIRNLETIKVATPSANAPNNGPFIGTLTGSDQVVGFDPVDHGPHFYVTGETGSGKTHTTRVLIENIVSQNHSVLTIKPSSKQSIGLNLPNKDNKNNIALNFTHYSADNSNQLPPPPDNIESLLKGLNAVSLEGKTRSQKQRYVTKIFETANQLDLDTHSLFIVLDEAHEFNNGDSAEAIQDLIREGRKFGVHIILISQSPKDFTYQYKKVRENTVNLFHRGEYFDYADRFIDRGEDISELERGQVIFPSSLNWSEFSCNIRDTMTRMWDRGPSQDELRQVENMFNPVTPVFDNAVTASDDSSQGDVDNPVDDAEALTGDEEELMQFIKAYIRENDEAPSYSKCWREDDAPFGSTKTRRLLDQLVDKNCLAEEEVERYGNHTQVYKIF